jgi:hypothetical protein
MIVITDAADAALSAPQRAVLAIQAAWAGKRPDPGLLIMSAQQRAEYDELFRKAALANVHLGRLIDELHAKAQQERFIVAAWELEALHAGTLDELRWSLEPVGDPKIAAVLEGGVPLCCPRTLDDLDETPAGRRWQVLNGSRDRLFGIVNRGYAAAEILEVIQGALGADPLHPKLRKQLDATLELADDVLWSTIAWLGPVCIRDDPSAEAEVARLMEVA